MEKINIDDYKIRRAARQMKIAIHPERLNIIEMLTEKDEMNVTEIYRKLNLKQPETSYHLTLMLEYNILKKIRRGKMSIYSLNTKLIEKIILYSDQLGRFA